jgi:hypothetical protein
MPDIYSHQGTWQFMAADLVSSPDIVHTASHDIESAFWVLLWITFAYMPSNWNVGRLSSFLKETMSPRVYVNSGGQNKLHFMQSPTSLTQLNIGRNKVLPGFLRGLQNALVIRHMPPPSPPDTTFAPLKILAEASGEKPVSMPMEPTNASELLEDQISEYNILKAALENHELVLATFNRALKLDGWPDDDEAEAQEVVQSNDVQTSMRSSSKRSRDVAEENRVYVPLPPAKRSGPA